MMNFSEITQVAHIIAIAGIAAVPYDQLLAIAAASVQCGASPVLAQIVADSNQPAVARARAYGRITTAFLTTHRTLTVAA